MRKKGEGRVNAALNDHDLVTLCGNCNDSELPGSDLEPDLKQVSLMETRAALTHDCAPPTHNTAGGGQQREGGPEARQGPGDERIHGSLRPSLDHLRGRGRSDRGSRPGPTDPHNIHHPVRALGRGHGRLGAVGRDVNGWACGFVSLCRCPICVLLGVDMCVVFCFRVSVGSRGKLVRIKGACGVHVFDQ